jgi:hypothetical protein
MIRKSRSLASLGMTIELLLPQNFFLARRVNAEVWSLQTIVASARRQVADDPGGYWLGAFCLASSARNACSRSAT